MNVITEKNIEIEWNDEIVVQIYKDEVGYQSEKAEKFAAVSKRRLITMIAASENITTDMSLILGNIVELKNIIVIARAKEAIIKINKQRYNFSHITDEFISLLRAI